MNYEEIYRKLCFNAKLQSREKGKGVYYEAHHIVPRCLGGTGTVFQYKTHPNIVLLTDREHFLAHRLLCKIHPKNKSLQMAWWAMCNQEAPNQKRIYKPSSRDYSEAKKLFIDSFSGKNHPLYGKGYLQIGQNNPAFGKVQSQELRDRKRISATKSWENPELRALQSEKLRGRKVSEETRNKMKKPKSEQHKKRIGLANIGKKIPLEKKINMLIGRYGPEWYNQKYPNGYDGVNKKIKNKLL